MNNKRKCLVTGVAGFIGYHTASALLKAGNEVIGIDNVNDYYDIYLKFSRLQSLKSHEGSERFTFLKVDLCEKSRVDKLFTQNAFDVVINLAAQAGVRYSLENPSAYLKSNIEGFLNILEACRHSKVEHLIYASSSSVYGLNTKLPFSESDPVDHPISLYAASKKSNELLAHTYSHLFNLATTGLRFFTVYGPWGRPDMAMYIFAKSILNDIPIQLYNGGEMLRDFTYVDDVVESIVRLCMKVPQGSEQWDSALPVPDISSAPYRIFNIGNHSPIMVSELVKMMENILGKKAILQTKPIQPGDVKATFADVSKLQQHVNFRPKTPIEVGLKRFLEWLVNYEGLSNGNTKVGTKLQRS